MSIIAFSVAAKEDSCAPPRKAACEMAAHFESESRASKVQLRTPDGMLILPMRANGPSLVVPAEVRWTHAEFDWLVRKSKNPGVNLVEMKRVLRAAAFAGCRTWQENDKPTQFLRSGGNIVYEYVSLDGVILDQFSIEKCSPEAIDDIPIYKTEVEQIEKRSRLVRKWEGARNLHILIGGKQGDCFLSEWGTPSSAWGNSRSHQVAVSTDALGRWMVKTALFDDGTAEPIFHFRNLEDCDFFKRRL